MACWSAGFGAVNVAHALADAGLEPERHAEPLRGADGVLVGVPFRVVLTDAELWLNDTNKRWKTKSRIHAAEEFGAQLAPGDAVAT